MLEDLAFQIPVSTVADSPPLQASRWQRVQVLLSPEDLDLLFEALRHPSLFFMGRFYPRTDFAKQAAEFRSFYREYVSSLSRGEVPVEEQCHHYFSALITETLQALYLLKGPSDNYLVRTYLPVIQLQHHSFTYSPLDNQVHSMVFGFDTITWGLQFSFPHMYIDPISKDICQTNDDGIANSALFKQLQRWIRQHTIPISFIATGSRFNTSLRLSRSCLSWIHRHPQLHELKVDDTILTP